MRIAVITGSRADRGPLEMVYVALESAGQSVRWVDVEPALPIKFRSEAASAAAAAMTAVAGELSAIPTDMVLLLGDRYEILGAAMGANMMGVPIAHLSGGDTTIGSQDDCFRDAITKLSHLHFVTHYWAVQRLVSDLGERGQRVHLVGCPGIDRIKSSRLLERSAAFQAIGMNPPLGKCVLAVMHPNTLGDTKREFEEVATALEQLPEDVSIIAIGPNADPDNHLIDWCKVGMSRQAAGGCLMYCEEVSHVEFLSLLKWCNVLVGNSSAGYYEAPSFGIRVVDIGERQHGRCRSSGLVNCKPEAQTILFEIMAALRAGPCFRDNPYGDGNAAEKIARVISGILVEPSYLLWKR